MLAGSSEPALYPSLESWRTILDALHEAHPDVRPALIGRDADDARTSSALDRTALLDHPVNPLDAYDLPLKAAARDRQGERAVPLRRTPASASPRSPPARPG
jgi:hypothetical protein